MSHSKIQFNRPYMTGKELRYITEAKSDYMLAGDGPLAYVAARASDRSALLRSGIDYLPPAGGAAGSP